MFMPIIWLIYEYDRKFLTWITLACVLEFKIKVVNIKSIQVLIKRLINKVVADTFKYFYFR